MFLSIYNKIKILIVEKVRPFTESKYSNPFIFFICFIEAIIFGREPIYGGRDGLRAVNVALASIVSANNNIPVTLEDV